MRDKPYIEREYVSGSGIYAFLPFDNLDKKGKGVFKIGMTGNFHNRIGNYHTYLPEGVYFKCFLKNPKKLRGDLSLEKYYKKIEKEIFKGIVDEGGKAISMSIRWRNEGKTEWVYASEEQIENAFDTAYRKYGGDLNIGELDHLPDLRKQLQRNKIYKGEVFFTQ